MCDAIKNAIGQASTNSKAAGKKKDNSLLIADRDADGRPVGIGGRRRERDIMNLVDGAQSGTSGLQIPGS